MHQHPGTIPDPSSRWIVPFPNSFFRFPEATFSSPLRTRLVSAPFSPLIAPPPPSFPPIPAWQSLHPFLFRIFSHVPLLATRWHVSSPKVIGCPHMLVSPPPRLPWASHCRSPGGKAEFFNFLNASPVFSRALSVPPLLNSNTISPPLPFYPKFPPPTQILNFLFPSHRPMASSPLLHLSLFAFHAVSGTASENFRKVWAFCLRSFIKCLCAIARFSPQRSPNLSFPLPLLATFLDRSRFLHLGTGSRFSFPYSGLYGIRFPPFPVRPHNC